MDGHALGHGEPRRHQHRRPDDRVELEDVLADQVDARRPEALGEVGAFAGIREGRVVVEEGIDPDVDDLGLVPGNGHPPLEPGATEGDVEQAALDERESLVVAVLRRDEVGLVGVQALERLLKCGQPEEPVVLLLDLELDPVDRAAVAVLELRLGLEVRAARAVPALVVAGIHVPVVVDALHHLGDLGHVLAVGCADEEVVRGVQLGGQPLEVHRVAVPELPGRDAELLRSLRHRLAVLVGAGEEEDVLPTLSHVSG